MTHRLLVDGVEGAGIPGDDPGLLLGLTAFETLRCYGRAIFRLGRHVERLVHSAAELEIPCPERAAIAEEIGAVASENARIRYTLTAGGHRVVDVAPHDLGMVGRSMRVATLYWEPPAFLPGAVKHGSRAAWLIAARKLGVDEVVLVDGGGFVLEASRSNVVAVVDGVLVTPPLDGRFLEGVTRGALLDAARQAGLELQEAPLHADTPLDELYLSSTLKELAPVVAWDGRPAPGAGPMGLALHAAFRALVARETGVDR